ncbi:frequency clock protein [Colletotrichum godetiae]|uniref:Frequency clock protein n=1 Tax=Colletotrichum godetiae TaxID=1209918 RepID=A0AAJ0ESK0_9PEZI|nr:frequency clock protein [Colletotrichum godetiae]KAK1673957.1 frequency clock protein [Colletotrichum godetiae]
MPDAQPTSKSARLPTSPKGHPLPRRSSPEHSITLRNHRLAHEATEKAALARALAATSSGSSPSPNRQSSDESHNTGPSDPEKWFDQNNENPTTMYAGAMDGKIDPPFFQKESDSSNDDAKPSAYPTHLRPPMDGAMIGANKPSVTHSSSADDYRSVIDDLTVEIKRLKDELKRYKQKGPELMKRDKLFEIKVHGLPKRKKRELESTLREFASGLESSTPSAEASSSRKKSRHNAHLHSGSGYASKHASSSSGSHSRPVDSAYASMSTGANSSGTHLARPSVSSRTKSSEQKVENYLKDIPEGLYPRHMVLTEKDRKKLIVRRLEQIFTGRISGRNLARPQQNSSANIASYAPIMVEPTTGNTTTHHGPSNVPIGYYEPSREAPILDMDGKKNVAKDGESSNSNGDQRDSSGNWTNAVDVSSTSPPDAPPPEQRPTRPLDLDPDRMQNPTANMDYIRHLGLAPPHLTALSTDGDVSPDADGWVYLNLLCSMAQLHMLNVAPDYIRSAVSEKSTKFQLSRDGRKIRWRGGTEGTKFSSDSSGNTSQRSRSDESDEAQPDDQGKKRKHHSGKNGSYSTSYGKNPSEQSKLEHPIPSADTFHYKPLFVHQSSSAEQTSLDDVGSSYGAAEDSNNGESRWDGSGSSRRKRRRLDGAIIYYSGAPFCTDLSGDPGDASPASYMTSSGQDQQLSSSAGFIRPALPYRTESGSALVYRPLVEGRKAPSVAVTTENGSDESDGGIEADFPWSNVPQDAVSSKLDACGLGGVIPDDHFVVVATTKRPKLDVKHETTMSLQSEDFSKLMSRITSPLGSSASQTKSTISESRTESRKRSPINIEYTSRSVRKLNPTPLPPPGLYFAFDSDTSDTSDDDESDLDDDSKMAGAVRALAPAVDRQYPDDTRMSSGEEGDSEPDNGDELAGVVDDEESGVESKIPLPPRDLRRTSSSSAVAAAGTARGRSNSAELPVAPGSSAATAGGAESGYSSGREESG